MIYKSITAAGKEKRAMKVRVLLLTLGALSLLWFPQGSTAGMSSANYSTPAEVLSGGGNAASSAGYNLSSTLGQPSPLGTSSSADYVNYPGFWQPDTVIGDSDGDGISDDDEINIYHTNPHDPDTDHDGLGDYLEAITRPCLDPLNEDSDGDGLSDGDTAGGGPGEDINNDGILDPTESDACDPDTDGDGLDDGTEVGCLNALDWDSDGDYLPDGFEQANLANPLGALDPCLTADGALDFDSDTNTNAHEYWNGSDPWQLDPVPNAAYNPACYYWGKADNNYYVQPWDIVAAQYAYVGTAVDYSMTLPHAYDVLDINANGNPDPPDIAALQFMFVEANLPGGYPSSPALLTLEDAPSGAVAIGDTTHITVSVNAQGPGPVPFSSGFSVVFWVESGNATLLGGEASRLGEPAGNRYDVSMEASLGALSNIVVRIDGPGPIVIRAKVPTCGVPTLGRWANEIQLGAPIVINP